MVRKKAEKQEGKEKVGVSIKFPDKGGKKGGETLTIQSKIFLGGKKGRVPGQKPLDRSLKKEKDISPRRFSRGEEDKKKRPRTLILRYMEKGEEGL